MTGLVSGQDRKTVGDLRRWTLLYRGSERLALWVGPVTSAEVTLKNTDTTRAEKGIWFAKKVVVATSGGGPGGR